MRLNMNEVQRPQFDIVLNDETKTELSLVLPQKYAVDEFLTSFTRIKNKNANEITDDDMFECCSTALSCNLQNKVITPEYVKSIWNDIDVVIFVSGYLQFIDEVQKLKNLSSPTIQLMKE